MKTQYDFIVCGAGSSGAVVARRLVENPAVSVLLLEAGGTDEIDAIMDPRAWPGLRNGDQAWTFSANASPRVNGRRIVMPMGKVLGGGSSINALIWARGHRSDWDCFATEAGDEDWNYRAVLEIYKRIETWLGAPDAERRGTTGPMIVQPAPDPHPLAIAMIEAFDQAGVPRFDDPNGAMMEGDGGVALSNLILREGRRHSVYRAYVHPVRDCANLTILTGAEIQRLVLDGNQATGVEFLHGGTLQMVQASTEIVLSLGAMHTPKILMLSGIGDRDDLQRFGIPVAQHLPGVGRNFQDHVRAPCVFESTMPIVGRNNRAEANAFWKSTTAEDAPDFQSFMAELPFINPEVAPMPLPPDTWYLTAVLLRPRSRGRLRLTAADPRAPLEIEGNYLSDPGDLAKLGECLAFSREIGHAAPLRRFARKELLPATTEHEAIARFLRNAAGSIYHQSCTAKMGRDSMSVVDGRLQVYGIDRLRIADASIMPRITAGNTMAPAVVIGERAADILKAAHRI